MIELRMTTILPMLDIMERFNNGENIKMDLESLLDHDDYKIEFERYGAHNEDTRFDKDDFVDFFLNIRSLKLTDIKPRGLRFRRDDLLHIMDNIEHYRDVYEGIKHYNESHVKEALKKTFVGLPDDVVLDEIHIIFNIGIGMSGGYIYKQYTQYDLNKVIDSAGPERILNTIAHECHHMGFNEVMKDFDESKISGKMDAGLLIYLSGEGTAIKYCNNFEGQLTKKLYPGEEMDVDQTSYDYYMNNFEKIYKQFRKDIAELRNGGIDTLEGLEKLFHKNYFYTDVVVEGQMIENYLGQPVAYNFGADLWGIIHDVYGREKVFECLKNPSMTINTLNDAFRAIDRSDLVI